jgi:hypothetical protein
LFRYEHFLSLAYYAGGDLQRAAQTGMLVARRNPNYTSNLRITVAALAGLGRLQEAAPIVDRLIKLQPEFSVEKWRGVFRDPAANANYMRHLRLAEVP